MEYGFRMSGSTATLPEEAGQIKINKRNKINKKINFFIIFLLIFMYATYMGFTFCFWIENGGFYTYIIIKSPGCQQKIGERPIDSVNVI